MELRFSPRFLLSVVRGRSEGVRVGTTAVAAGEVRAWPVTDLGQRYRRYRLVDEAAEAAMVQSLRRHGQATPVVVCWREETAEVIDGFKRLAAAGQVPG